MSEDKSKKGGNQSKKSKFSIEAAEKQKAPIKQNVDSTENNDKRKENLCKEGHPIYIEKGGQKDNWDKASVIATIGGAVLSLAAVVVAAFALRASKDAVTETKKSVDA